MAGRRRSGTAALLTAIALIVAAVPSGVSAADPSAGYDSVYEVLDPAGQPRTDGSIQVGDDLSLRFAAVDGTPATECIVRLTAVGGSQMQTFGRISDGACELDIRLPDFPDPQAREGHDPGWEGLNLCAWAVTITFADGQHRDSSPADHGQPAGWPCGETQHGFGGGLAFRIADGGTPRPFASDPAVLSWNPADWGTGVGQLAFGEPWHVALPAWIVHCSTYLNGSWTTVIRPAILPDCPTWDVRVPGVLPATLPWDGDAGDWTADLVVDYTTDEGVMGWTLVAQRAGLASSDGVFQSSLPSIFPTDLATTRFVTAGERWHPEFQLGGGDATACELNLITVPPTFPADPPIWEPHAGVVDEEERCTFDLDPLALDESHQFYVTATYADVDTANLTFGGTISAIAPPAPPAIEPPTAEPDGDTGIEVEPGDGQGLALDVEVQPAEDAVGPQPLGAAGPLCADRALTGDLSVGGSIPPLSTSCDLEPGNYVAVASMVDAAGIVTTSERPFTVRAPRPTIIGRTPGSGATGVRRDVHPAIRFDMPVRGVSDRTFLLLDTTKGTRVPAAVSYNPSTWRATLVPAALLVAGRTYRLEASGRILNADGRALLPVRWTFKVTTDGTPPSFSRSPSAGATGVSRATNVVLQFSEPVGGVDGTTVRLRDDVTKAWITASVTYDAALRRATLDPAPTLIGLRTYQVVVGIGIKDAAGNPLAPVSWRFTTRS